MRILLVCVTIAFTAFTAWLVLTNGYVACWKQLLSTPLGWQVTADISIALFFVLSWIRRDARATSRPFWPYAAVTLTLGSLGPLFYFLLGPAKPASRANRVGQQA